MINNNNNNNNEYNNYNLPNLANLAMGWIDYQNAYDLLPHSWIIETMKLTGMASNE